MSEVFVVDDVLQPDPLLMLQHSEELQVVLLGQSWDLRHSPLLRAVRIDKVGSDGYRHLSVQTLPPETFDRNLSASSADDDVVLLEALEDAPIGTPDLGQDTPPLPVTRGLETQEALSDVDCCAEDQTELEKYELQHPDADVVHRSISKLRVELLGPQSLQILHHKGPELDHVVPVHVVPGLDHGRLGSEVLHLHGHSQPTRSST